MSDIRSAVIELTEEQTDLVLPLLQNMKPGETLMAQVYARDMRLKVLTAEESNGVRKACGTIPDLTLQWSAADAYAELVNRVKLQ